MYFPYIYKSLIIKHIILLHDKIVVMLKILSSD